MPKEYSGIRKLDIQIPESFENQMFLHICIHSSIFYLLELAAFNDRTHAHDLNTELVHYSDPHCSEK